MKFLAAEVNWLVRPCARHRGVSIEVFDPDEFLRHVSDHLVVGDQPIGRNIIEKMFTTPGSEGWDSWDASD